MKKLRLSGFDFRTLFLFSFLALAACSTGLDTDEDGEVEEGETPAETAEAAPTDAVPQEVAEVEAPPPEAPAAEESPPAAVEQQPVAQASEPAPAEVAPPAAPEPAPIAAAEPEPAPVSDPVSAEGTSYTVKAGDTLMKISWEQYGTLFRWREIYQSNKARIADPNNVPPGTTIELPAEGRNPAAAAEHNGEQYLIVKGDTLGKISNKVYGTLQKWKKIWENNRQLIRDPNKIYAGFYLYYVPETKMTSTEEVSSPEAEPTG